MTTPVQRIAEFLNVSEEKVQVLFRDVQKCFKAEKIPSYAIIARCIEETNCDVKPFAIARAIQENWFQLISSKPDILPPSKASRVTQPQDTRYSKVASNNKLKQTRFMQAAQEARYYVYRNSSYQATVHYASCSFCKNGKGTGTGKSNRWYGPFESRMQAMARARQLVNGDVRACDHCGAAPPVGFAERSYGPD